MTSVFEIFAKLGLDSSDFDKGLDNAKSTLSNMGSAVGSGLGTIAKIGTAAVATASAGIAALGTMAVKGYADYEQLSGGIETLFKTSADAVMGFASEAYKTAGLSSNEYMETVTSFSASLISSLGGDTAKAADMANMAIVDMADDANKMGSSIESIQNAYQGFAKQNYTMLDNLKLGRTCRIA
jgi:phage-related protein